ncbi:MAG: pyridoxal kinase [Rhodoferax sp.]|nr:pyridoxal kinase [Rhodoferax sp.]
MPLPTILSISSQVVYGHVGNAAIVPALHALGFEVLAIPTVLLAHHPGHGPPQGRVTPATEVAALVDGLEQVGALADARAALTGYLGLAQTAEVAADAVLRLRRLNPGALYLCDPVIGDNGKVYVREGVEDAIRERLLRLADIVTPNHFELERLSGQSVRTLAQALAAARYLLALGPKTVVVTSLEHDQLEAGEIATLVVTATAAWICITTRILKVPRGSGDLVAALLLGQILRGRTAVEALALAVSAVQVVLAASVGQPEMRLVDRLGDLAAPPALLVHAVGM